MASGTGLAKQVNQMKKTDPGQLVDQLDPANRSDVLPVTPSGGGSTGHKVCGDPGHPKVCVPLTWVKRKNELSCPLQN